MVLAGMNPLVSLENIWRMVFKLLEELVMRITIDCAIVLILDPYRDALGNPRLFYNEPRSINCFMFLIHVVCSPFVSF